ncbi:FtsK/SpoIIIE domain-containing protein [Pseudonocardia alni]|uniref:FtsK/SpoIIIE domain-containing protein n=1 Tax=Pseudonocardia alni TaxID=33907 RepID=UPI00332AC1B1
MNAETVRALLVRLGAWITRRSVDGWRTLRTLLALVRLGLLWRSFCGNTGLALQRLHTAEHGRMRVEVFAVPRLDRYTISPHGWSMRVRLRPGQHLDDYSAVCTPLRHTARVQSVKALELRDQPGFLELRILRRDPLTRVTERPREQAPGRLICGSTDNGDPLVLDFAEHPHYLISGATGSGKSMLLSGLQAAIAPTDAAMVCWDLKFGIEAEAWRERYTEVCIRQDDVLASCGRVLALAEQRAGILRDLGVRNVAEADALGVHLRRVYVLIDEVAEIALDHDGERTADRVLRELLRIVQLVRAMGIHVILCGQRFGSDLGKSVTSIRAQVSGRVCLQVNDVQTAEMVLGGLDAEVQKRALSLHRPGMGIVHAGQDWHYARCSYLTTAEVRALATAHADRRVSWDELSTADIAAAKEPAR